MTKRLLALTVCFCVCAGVLARASRYETIPPRASFSEFPTRFGEWEGRPAAPFEDRVLKVLGVDDHLNYLFFRGSQGLSVYAGYYESQRQGDAIHSPMNCLPGAGWQPVETGRLSIPGAGGGEKPVEVNRVLIQKGEQVQLVLYWYQGRGRVVASEYWSKIYLVTDSMRHRRSDAALVRLVVPVQRAEPTAIAAAEQLAVEFAQALLPRLARHIPA